MDSGSGALKMNYTYELSENGQVVKRSDGAAIPVDPLNMDYQNYLIWLENKD